MLQTIRFWVELLDYLYCRWAITQIRHTHKDVAEILQTINSFEAKHGRWEFSFW